MEPPPTYPAIKELSQLDPREIEKAPDVVLHKLRHIATRAPFIKLRIKLLNEATKGKSTKANNELIRLTLTQLQRALFGEDV
jgi:hypothetical protein